MPFRKPARHVDRVFLHCSASDDPDHDDIDTIRRWHVDERGWSDVGYHYFIRSDGTLQEGRPLERIPAAQAGHNAGTVAICLHGLAEESFTGRPAPHPDRPRPRDRRGAVPAASPSTAIARCRRNPARCFPTREVLGLDGEGRMTGGIAVSHPRPPPIRRDTRDKLQDLDDILL